MSAVSTYAAASVIPYSLKFSRLKNFAVFAGCTLTTKILSREKFSTGIRTYACAIICGRGHLSLHKLLILLLALSESSLVGSWSWF